MPTLRSSHKVTHLSPRFLLLSRCEHCAQFVNWVHHGDRLYATCCGTIFRAEALDESRTQYAVMMSPVGGDNVIDFPPYLRARGRIEP